MQEHEEHEEEVEINWHEAGGKLIDCSQQQNFSIFQFTENPSKENSIKGER